MDISLTRDADKAICEIYKHYLRRCKEGIPKENAGDFVVQRDWPKTLFFRRSKQYISSVLRELNRAGLVRLYIRNGFALEDAAVIYMKSRRANQILNFFAWFEKIKNALPFV